MKTCVSIRLINFMYFFILTKSTLGIQQPYYGFAENDQPISKQPPMQKSHQLVQLQPSALQVSYTGKQK